MADDPAGLVSAYYQILQAGAGSYDPERLRLILVPDLDFDGPIAGHIRGADRFTRGVAGFIETQKGIRFLQQVITPDAAAVLYNADLPGHAAVRRVLPVRRREDHRDQAPVRSGAVYRVRRALSPRAGIASCSSAGSAGRRCRRRAPD
jgi:hypothetical protein